jgi:hypothetical protein
MGQYGWDGPCAPRRAAALCCGRVCPAHARPRRAGQWPRGAAPPRPVTPRGRRRKPLYYRVAGRRVACGRSRRPGRSSGLRAHLGRGGGGEGGGGGRGAGVSIGRSRDGGGARLSVPAALPAPPGRAPASRARTRRAPRRPRLETPRTAERLPVVRRRPPRGGGGGGGAAAAATWRPRLRQLLQEVLRRQLAPPLREQLLGQGVQLHVDGGAPPGGGGEACGGGGGGCRGRGDTPALVALIWRRLGAQGRRGRGAEGHAGAEGRRATQARGWACRSARAAASPPPAALEPLRPAPPARPHLMSSSTSWGIAARVALLNTTRRPSPGVARPASEFLRRCLLRPCARAEQAWNSAPRLRAAGAGGTGGMEP